MKKYLITGGAGFIGGHIAEFLSNNGHDVTILDSHPATVSGPGRWQHTAAERREWHRCSPTKVQTSTTLLPSTGKLLLDQGGTRLPSGGFRRATRCSRSRTPEVQYSCQN